MLNLAEAFVFDFKSYVDSLVMQDNRECEFIAHITYLLWKYREYQRNV